MAETTTPTLVFIPGAWHSPACYDKVIKILRDKHNIKCIAITLPSTQDNPEATFKDDIDAARNAIISETAQGRDVIVIAHSYGGMLGNSAIKGLTIQPTTAQSAGTVTNDLNTDNEPVTTNNRTKQGHVTGLILIASGFTITGVAFMDPFLGYSPPQWRKNLQTGYVDLLANPQDMFYHDLSSKEEQEFWTQKLTTQSVKSLYEGSEFAYAGWRDVQTWYIGTIEDRGLPVVAQRVQVGVARACGAMVNHVELRSSHSPFLSVPGLVVGVALDAVSVTTLSGISGNNDDDERKMVNKGGGNELESESCKLDSRYSVPSVELTSPLTWFRYGLPYSFGRVVGWGIVGFLGLRRLLLWNRR